MLYHQRFQGLHYGSALIQQKGRDSDFGEPQERYAKLVLGVSAVGKGR